MKAVVLKANETLVWEEIPKPEVPPGWARIRVEMCGVCGSDIPRVFFHAVRKYPIVLGHEFVGVVESVGEGVENPRIGERVVGAPLLPCGKCAACREGNYSLCPHYSFLGSRQNGAMAEYVALPSENALPLDESIPLKQAATVEPSTVALHAFRLARFVAGKSVAVLGCGIIGLYAIQWAKILGASHITAISRGRAGLETAKTLGANQMVSVQGRGEDDIERAFPAEGYDFVFESCGAEETMRLALRAVARKGTVCLIGTPKRELTFPISVWERINRKECWITGSWMSYSAPFPGEEWSMTIKAMESGQLQLAPGMIAGIYPMSQADEAFRTARSGDAKGRILLSNLETEF